MRPGAPMTSSSDTTPKAQGARRWLGRLTALVVLTGGLLLAQAGPAGAQASEPEAPATTPAATTPEPVSTDPVPSPEPSAPTQPEFPAPTVRACAPCYERRPPAPTRLGLEAGQPRALVRATTPAPSFRLPETGTPTATVAAAGALLLALGLVVLAAARPRRSLDT
jgi:LPXTG-motif cell wall-anchored protein